MFFDFQNTNESFVGSSVIIEFDSHAKEASTYSG
jgi:hypothetical protein